MKFLEFLQSSTVYLDGGMGTQLQARGLGPGEKPERWNLTHPDVIVDIHTAYFDAGSNVVCANTFGANRLKFSAEELENIVKAALDNARAARDRSVSTAEKFIALDIGPSGKLLRPLGDLDFEDAVALFAETVKLGVRYGADLIVIETMSDCYETKAALLAAKENSDLPVLVTNAYGESGRLMTGASPAAMAAMLEGMGADAIGANCSLGPKQLRGVAEELLANASVPVILKPNAGLPKTVDGRLVYDVTPEEFTAEVKSLMAAGVRVVGGCCGTTPAYIRALHDATADVRPLPLQEKNITAISSGAHAVCLGDAPVLIGTRIDPAVNPELADALAEEDMDYITDEGFEEQDAGADILRVCTGTDDAALLAEAVQELQAAISLPLQIAADGAKALEAALRRYNGKAMIHAVNAARESMEAVFPLVKKYGGTVAARMRDENGIPTTEEDRLALAERILSFAAACGIAKKDIVFDLTDVPEIQPLIREKTGCHTVLAASDASVLTQALENGLSAAMLDPLDGDVTAVLDAYR